ncbi:hypothetical protein [Clostridium hydrogenum]|uniref:hypothetical protein n=1 Tax=Clostridium hydrogenum TaxID=2855764 RepID=UPI001F36C75E|nr:hypothetical protein [Clostridium hydrogenum]
MQNAKLNFYFFGDTGEYNKYNPAYACSSEYADKILYLIAKNEPFSISKIEIARSLNIDEEKVKRVIDKIQLINAVESKDDAYKIKFPVFLEEDVIEMEKYINNEAKIIGDKIIEMKEVIYEKVSKLRCTKNYEYKRILYHVICDQIFDGTAFEFFSERNTFCASKIQPDNRDYIIVAYEDNDLIEKHSNKLLCSSNNYRCKDFIFNSFGDSNGSRKDLFRFFKLVQKSTDKASQFNELNMSYNKLLDHMNQEIAIECGKLICSIIKDKIIYNQLSEKEKNLAKFLIELEYIDVNSQDNVLFVAIPVFYDFEISTIIKEISNIILTSIFPIVKDVFDNFKANLLNSTVARHKVDIKEAGNEVWHQIFGAVNEYLVKEGFVEAPNNREEEGRYLKSIVISAVDNV